MKPCASVPGRAIGDADVDAGSLVGVAGEFGGDAVTSRDLFCPSATHSTRLSDAAQTTKAAPASSHRPAPKPIRTGGLWTGGTGATGRMGAVRNGTGFIAVGTCATVAAPAAARARSPADEKRSSGCLAIPRAITASNAKPTPGRVTLGGGGGALSCTPTSCIT